MSNNCQETTIQLSNAMLSIVDVSDLNKLLPYNWHFSSHGYAYRKLHVNATQKTIYMHHYVFGKKLGHVVDHINGDKLDNRKSNLRFCSNKENVRKQKIRTNNKTGVRGISIKKTTGKFQATIMVDGKSIHLGYFHHLKDASAAYSIAAKNHFGEFAY